MGLDRWAVSRGVLSSAQSAWACEPTSQRNKTTSGGQGTGQASGLQESRATNPESLLEGEAAT